MSAVFPMIQHPKSLALVLEGRSLDDTVSRTSHIWEAEQYHHNSSAQSVAALRLLDTLPLSGSIKVLDVGCGDGKITKEIARRLPDGSVFGTDISPEMIAFAEKTFTKDSYPNLTFSCLDGQTIEYSDSIDLVFSSFAIQWMRDKESFFHGANKSLKSGGVLAVTIPLGISSALEQSIKELISLSEWVVYFNGFSPGWHFVEPDEYYRLLAINKFVLKHFAVVPQDAIFDSREGLENYIHQWFSYLRPLPDHLKEKFFKQVIDRYFQLEPIEKSGQAHLKFARLEIIADKATF